MWFMNKVANPFVRLILRSPLHGLMSTSLLLVTYRGRKTGKEYTLPAQYARDEQDLIILPGQPEKKTWWRNLRGGGAVKLRLAGKTLPAQAEVVDGKTDPAFAARALEVYLRRFPVLAGLYHVRRLPDGEFDAGDLRAVAGSLVLVRVCLDPR